MEQNETEDRIAVLEAEVGRLATQIEELEEKISKLSQYDLPYALRQCANKLRPYYGQQTIAGVFDQTADTLEGKNSGK